MESSRVDVELSQKALAIDDDKGGELDDGGSWFDEYGYLIKDIPEECVHDCSHSGECIYDCEYWVNELGFDKDFPVAKAKEYLKTFGGWEDEEIDGKDAHDLAVIVLWVFCGFLKDEPDYPLGLA